MDQVGELPLYYRDSGPYYAGPPDSNGGALRNYTQSTSYDAAGNILEMKHQSGLADANGDNAGAVLWRRGYLIEEGNNQLRRTSLPGDDLNDPERYSQGYRYNPRGAMVFMPHLRSDLDENIVRDFRDQIRKAELDEAGNVSWYAYDAGGQRVRKLWDKGGVVEERIYVGPYEVWRQQNSGGAKKEERQTLHIMDDQRRVVMIETMTVTGGVEVQAPQPRFRYQLDDDLGSAMLELDARGGVITYEEYHPYGTTAWWCEKGGVEVSRKRYRYTGMERDEETGLSYHHHRYCIPWLGRWASADPTGLGDGGNRHVYCHGNPVRGRDRTGLFGWDTALDAFQLGLAGAGLIPGWGEIADAVDLAVSAARGDEVGVALSTASLLPTGGQIPGAAKIARMAEKLLPASAVRAVASTGDQLPTPKPKAVPEVGAAPSAPKPDRPAEVGDNPAIKNDSVGKVADASATKAKGFASEFPEGHGYARQVSPGGTGDAFSGHGELRKHSTWPPTTTVPEGLTITMPAQGVKLPDGVGRMMEAGDWDGLNKFIAANPHLADRVAGMKTYVPGDVLPNYTLLAPDKLHILERSMTVSGPTTLDSIFGAFAGSGRNLCWAACTVTRVGL